MTRIKVCGITNLTDALLASRLGADALGFVFAPSPRRITTRSARQIILRLPPFVTTVGVFRDQPCAYVNRIVSACGVALVQLHGNEPPAYCRRIERPVIKAFTVSNGTDPTRIHHALRSYPVAGWLLDRGAGEGCPFDWKIIRSIDRPVIVAGGLTAGNVRRLIDLFHPFGVDVSSGVEASPGRKDRVKLARFITAVREEDL